MSYLVFARKWRPLVFDDVVGQEHITSTLKRAIEKSRVAHAYLFTGTRGVGKTTTARVLAMAVNCEKGPTTDPCGKCESCKSIINGSSLDVLEIDGASNNGVDDIRELRENVAYTSMHGKYRIFIIDEVHMLTKGAFNALLKTLEEPPKNVIFIFATTEPQKVPDTIISRCQRYDFRRIASEQIILQLEKICGEENISFEKSGIGLIARKADGSMRDALSLLDQVYSFCRENISEKEVRSVLGLVETEVYNGILEAVAEKKPLPVIQAVEDILNRGFDLLEFIVGFQEYLRTLLFARFPGALEIQRMDYSNETLRKQSNQAFHFSEGDLLRMIEIIRKAETDLKWSSFPRFLVETSLIKLVYMDSSVSVVLMLLSIIIGNISDTSGYIIPSFSDYKVIDKKNIDKIYPSSNDFESEKNSDIAIASIQPSDSESNSFMPSQGTWNPDDVATKWSQFIEDLMEDRPNLGTFLSMAHILESTENSIDIRFQKEFGFQFAEVTKTNNRNIIQKKLSSFAGKPVDLHITIEKEKSGKKKERPRLSERKKEIHPSLKDDIKNEPIIKNVIEVFNTEIL